MRKRILKAISATVSAAVCLVSVPVFAYDLPHDFWALNDRYAAAVEANDYSGIAYCGSRVIDLIAGEPSNEQTDNIMGSRTYDTAFAYFFNGDYQNAAKYFSMYIPYGEKMGWSDGVRIATEFVKQLTSELYVYKQTNDNQMVFGAKNEPNGVLRGQISEKTEADDSMVLLYLEYGYSDELNWAGAVMNEARESGKSVELALNFPDQGDTARAVSAADEYLNQLYLLMSGYTDVPVFCRIGAEVNIWGNICTPDEFKNAFCIIANKMRALPNMAIVWSVAHTDPWKSESRPYTMDDYYPGDENTDYAGVTIYCNKYFEGREWQGVEQFNEICFKTGYSSDPVLMIKDFAEKYGSRKPIMISECGSAYYTGGEINQNDQEWAAKRLKEIYSYIPMVYPQVKLIAYFNKQMPNEANWYDLDSSPVLKNAYDEMKFSPWFIKGSSKNKSEVFFEKLDDTIDGSGKVRISAYSHMYGVDDIKVEYYLDDNWITTVSAPPYTAEIDISNASRLRVTASGSNGGALSKEYSISGGSAENDTDGLNDAQFAAIEKMRDMGVMTGYEDGSIRPYNTITRAEFAAMLCRLKGLSADKPCSFDDSEQHWASKYIKSCVDIGAINGVGDNLFAPEDNITMEQAFKIITISCGMAKADAEYPKGFIAAAEANGISNNLTTDLFGSDLKRIDAAMIMAQSVK